MSIIQLPTDADFWFKGFGFKERRFSDLIQSLSASSSSSRKEEIRETGMSSSPHNSSAKEGGNRESYEKSILPSRLSTPTRKSLEMRKSKQIESSSAKKEEASYLQQVFGCGEYVEDAATEEFPTEDSWFSRLLAVKPEDYSCNDFTTAETFDDSCSSGEIESYHPSPVHDPLVTNLNPELNHNSQPGLKILGASSEYEITAPCVMSPSLMRNLQQHLPFCKRGESFWLKYSLVRDGASMSTFLSKLRGTNCAIMAMETVDGEIFGAFTTVAWHFDSQPFGTRDSFLWKRKKQNRDETSRSVSEEEVCKEDAGIDVFGFAYENNCVQMCNNYPVKVAIGGGSGSPPPDVPVELQENMIVQPHEWGYGICFEGDSLVSGTTSPCLTFNSPSLSEEHKNGTPFELINLEVWAITPCISVEDAETMEFRNLFAHDHMMASPV